MGVLRGLLTRNWTLKLSAFGIALLLWASVRVEAPSRQSVSDVPVRVNLTDPQWTLLEEPSPSAVTVRFGGPSRDLIRMALDRPSIMIPMDQVTSADTTLVLRNEWVRVQDRPNVVVEEIRPSSIRLRLEPIQRLDLPPALRLEGELQANLAMAAPPTVLPPDLRVSGPQSRVAQLDSIPLRPFDLSDLGSSGRVPVSVDTEALEGIQTQPEQVEVEFELEERQLRRLENVPVELDVEGWEDRWEISPSEVVLVIGGASSIVADSEGEGLRARLPINEEELPSEAGQEISAAVPLPDGFSPLLELSWDPEEVTVRRLGPSEDDADVSDADVAGADHPGPRARQGMARP